MNDILKIEDSFKFEYKGQVQNLSFATMTIIDDHDERMAKASDEDYVKEIQKTLVNLGLKEDFVKKVSPAGQMTLLRKAFGLEKK